MKALRNYSGYLVLFVAVLLFISCSRAVEFDLEKLVEGRAHMANYIAEMWPPNFSIFPKVWDGTLQTIQLAFVATIIAAIISIPFGFLGASNVMKTKPQRALASVVRFLLNANRSIDAIIVATFFVSAVGLGPFAGTLALAVHSVGMLGKMFFESVEGVDKGPIEALEAAGASRLQVLRWAILPQALPYFLSHTLFRFELNIRGAVVLGLVGAGGIGFLLTEYQRLFQYQNVSLVLFTIVVLVMGIDALSGWTRRKLL
ncbi:MAG: phosphonate ABC transporter, permease protein PhnE [Bdellovibrionales bacterium]|nr:phosphonate ABC transporter, permease protein PhnE [Bdellovibrionales bacterium]